MQNITAIGDATADGSHTVSQPNNIKVTYNGIILCLLGATVHGHSTHGSPAITDTIQNKVFYNGIPFSIYTSKVGCGTTIAGSNINPKVFITP